MSILICIISKQHKGSFELKPLDKQYSNLTVIGVISGKMRRRKLTINDKVKVQLTDVSDVTRPMGTIIEVLDRKPR
jgi:translation initiation factor IF-1